MSIVRAPRPAQAFTIIENAVLRDERLSMRGLGLLVRLLSRPDNWETNSEALAREFGCGREQMRGVLNELVDAGYMRLHKEQNAQGHWSSKWHVFDSPETAEAQISEPKPESPDSGNPKPGNPYFGSLGAIKKNRRRNTDTKNTPFTPHGEKTTRKRADLASLPKPDDVTDQVWADFLAMRTQKRAPVTETALKLLRAEAERAGISLTKALETCCANGWQGFKADWFRRTTVAAPQSVHSGFDQIDYGSGIRRL